MALKKDILKVSGIKVIRDFLTVIKSSDSHFLAIYSVKFNKGELTDMYDLIKLFKQFYKLNYI